MRKESIEELLVEVKENIEKVKENNQIANYDNTIKSLLRPKVKATLEHLRSSLDYMLHDIDDYYAEKNNISSRKELYFPIKNNKKKFDVYIKKDFPNLYVQDEKIYRIIEQTQVFKCKTTWLADLCYTANDNKHDNLLEQNRTDNMRVNIGHGAIIIENSNDIRINNLNLDGKIMNNFHLIDNEIFTDRPDLVDTINWSNFTFVKNGKDVIKLLEMSYNSVFELKNKIYRELCKV